MSDEMDDKFYSVKELAASRRLPISESTIRREIEDGNLPHYRWRGQIFISEKHIQEYKRRFEFRSERNRNISSSILSYALR